MSVNVVKIFLKIWVIKVEIKIFLGENLSADLKIIVNVLVVDIENVIFRENEDLIDSNLFRVKVVLVD